MAPVKYIFFLLVMLPLASPAQDFVILPERISTVECSFIRKNTYNGFSKVVRGRFYYDAGAKKAVYDYSGPFNFRFIINDTVLYGIDTKRNRGYALYRGTGPAGCDDPCGSIHFFDAFLRSVNADSASRTLLASIGLALYFERYTGPQRDVIEQDRDYGAINCIESFNAQGEMVEQTTMRYNAKKLLFDFPIRIMKRKKCNGMITADTVLVSGATVNRAIRPEAFALPAGCRLHEVRDATRGFFPEGNNGNRE
jgi:hypothetical protein